MSTADRLDRFQQKHPWAGFPLAVAYKFVDDQGSYLTAMITYYGFLSLFPLLLLLVSVLGFVLSDNAGLQEQVLDSALARIPVLGQQLAGNVQSLRGSLVAVVVGLVGGVYGSLGVVQATQNAFNKVWAVPRHARPNPITARLRSLLMLLIIGLGAIVSTLLSGVSSVADTIAGNEVGTGLRVLAAGGAVLLNIALIVLAFRLLTGERTGNRQVLPGALLAAVCWQLLQTAGTYYLGNSLRGTSATYGLFGVVLGLLAWLYLSAFTVVLGAELNAVRVRKLYPRSLMTPFTDDVDLTQGDRKAYESYAQTEAYKGFETVDVQFDETKRAKPEDEPDEE